MGLAFAAMMGWCGTRWPGWILWWILHHKPNPPDPPEPWRELLISVLGAVGGVIAVRIIGPDYPDAGLMGTALIAFFGGTFLGTAAGTVMNMAKGGAR
jgi:hypothetical protein